MMYNTNIFLLTSRTELITLNHLCLKNNPRSVPPHVLQKGTLITKVRRDYRMAQNGQFHNPITNILTSRTDVI